MRSIAPFKGARNSAGELTKGDEDATAVDNITLRFRWFLFLSLPPIYRSTRIGVIPTIFSVYLTGVSIYHNMEQTRLRLGVVKAFLQQVLLHGYWQPGRSSRALGVVASPHADHDLQPLPGRPRSAPQGAELML